MKLRLFSSIFCCLFFCNSFGTIRTVSNSPAFPGQYNTVGAAIAASSPGDTIYIMPSNIGYDGFTLDKRLVIIGSGLNPQRPSHLGTGAPAFGITIDGAGSSIMGINFWAGSIVGNSSAYVNNLYLSDCYFGALEIFSSNLIIENCIFNENFHPGESNSNNVYQNNIFNRGIILKPSSNAIIRNNIFASHDVNLHAFYQQNNGEFAGPGVQILNNIFYKNNPTGINGVANNCTFKNNIYYLTNNPVPTNATSSGNINADPLFVNYPAAGSYFDWLWNYKLQPASPGINYGTDGKDISIWGGQVPVNAGFEPPIPRIYDLTAASISVPVGGSLQLTIKATKAQ
jgi:hypothetical protein